MNKNNVKTEPIPIEIEDALSNLEVMIVRRQGLDKSKSGAHDTEACLKMLNAEYDIQVRSRILYNRLAEDNDLRKGGATASTVKVVHDAQKTALSWCKLDPDCRRLIKTRVKYCESMLAR